MAGAPELSTWAMLAVGFAGLGLRRLAAARPSVSRLASAKSLIPSNTLGAAMEAALFCVGRGTAASGVVTKLSQFKKALQLRTSRHNV